MTSYAPPYALRVIDRDLRNGRLREGVEQLGGVLDIAIWRGVAIRWSRRCWSISLTVEAVRLGDLLLG
jgi:hypothetical protein